MSGEDGLWGWAVGMGCGDGLWEAAGAAATPAAFNLGLCRLRGSYPPPAATKTILYRRDDGAAGGPFQTAATMVLQRFSSLGLKSRIIARWRAFSGKSLQRFLSSPPKIQNRCTLEGVFRQIHAVIPKFTP